MRVQFLVDPVAKLSDSLTKPLLTCICDILTTVHCKLGKDKRKIVPKRSFAKVRKKKMFALIFVETLSRRGDFSKAKKSIHNPKQMNGRI